MKSKTIVYLYNSLFDPLIQSNIFLYIRKIASDVNNSTEFAIITFEDPANRASPEEEANWKNKLKNINIHWYPCSWNKGTSLILKAFDFIKSFTIILILRLKGYNNIISLASVAGAFCYIYSRTLFIKHYLYQYEPHSEFEVDAGRYSQNSLKYILLNFLEKKSAYNAKVISTGTSNMIDRLNGWGVSAKIFKIPSVVDEIKFNYSETNRLYIRNQYNISEKAIVLLYPGKFGGLYYNREIAIFFSELLGLDKNLYALIVTPDNQSSIQKMFIDEGVPSDRSTITHAGYNDIDKFYSASDIGVIAIPPSPSQQFRSPIKVGEFLSSGIPYIICKGVSEDDKFAVKNNVGIVTPDFSREKVREVYPLIKKIAQEDKAIQRERCRKCGIEYRGFNKLSRIFEEALNYLQK